MSRIWLVVLVLSAAVALSGCRILVDSETGKWTTEIGAPKPTLEPDAPCMLTTCHGLELECAEEGPEMCTMEYQIGDFCREYATCGIVEGQCVLTKQRLVDECVSCVELCDSGLDGSDPTKAFECEQQCREQLDVMERSF